MPLTIRQMPFRDHQGGDHQPDEPLDFYADDVENKPVADAPDTPESVTSTADDVDNQPDGTGVETEPQTHTTDWPPAAENKTVKPEQADAKTVDATSPAPKTTRAKRAKKGS